MLFHDFLDFFGSITMFFSLLVACFFISSQSMFLAMMLCFFASIMQFFIELGQFFRTQVKIGCFAGDAHRGKIVLVYITLAVARFYLHHDTRMIAGIFLPGFMVNIGWFTMVFISRKDIINCFIFKQM